MAIAGIMDAERHEWPSQRLLSTDRWSLRGEYRYSRFELDRSVSTKSNDVDPANLFSRIMTFDGTTRTVADFHLGKLGVAYNFCYCE